MWNYVGIVRTDKRLRARGAPHRAARRKRSASTTGSTSSRATCSSCATSRPSPQLIVECAAARRESRGLHYTLDYPETDPKMARDMVIKRGVPAHLGRALMDSVPRTPSEQADRPLSFLAAAGWTLLVIVLFTLI